LDTGITTTVVLTIKIYRLNMLHQIKRGLEMTKRKKINATLILVIIVILGYMVYLQEVFQVDEDLIQSMSVAGIHLLDSEKEVIKKLGTGKPRAGCFGCSLYADYPDQKIRVATLAKNRKVVDIFVYDHSHSILGIHVGDPIQTAIPKLQKHGLVPLKERGYGIYHKDDLIISIGLDHHQKISNITLSVEETTRLLPIPQPIY
jgi:hypothetical protein